MIKLITQNPKGAVTNAVCALSNFRDEAYFQISSSRQLHGNYMEGDAVAALHLVSFSQLSGGQFPWQDAFAVLCDWLIQTSLPSAENPCTLYNNMSALSQYIVKATIVSPFLLW